MGHPCALEARRCECLLCKRTHAAYGASELFHCGMLFGGGLGMAQAWVLGGLFQNLIAEGSASERLQ